MKGFHINRMLLRAHEQITRHNHQPDVPAVASRASPERAEDGRLSTLAPILAVLLAAQHALRALP